MSMKKLRILDREVEEGQLRYGKPREGELYLTLGRRTHWKTATANFEDDKVLILDDKPKNYCPVCGKEF